MRVMKFGGTSVGTASSMQLVSEAITIQQGQKIVVLSASAGITDKLINITTSLLDNHQKAYQIFNDIESVAISISSELGLNVESVQKVKAVLFGLKELIEGVELLNFISPNIRNKIIAKGEMLSTTIFSEYYSNQSDSCFLDITNHLVYNSKSDEFQINDKNQILSLLEKHGTIITQGFICKDDAGHISNLGRGGSDYSAAIIASEMNAVELQIWTDVNGIMSADPRLITKPVTKDRINLENLSKMAFFGAKVIHPSTLRPTVDARIPVRILNTFDIENKGTLVTQNKDNPIPTLTIKRKCYQYSFKQSKKKSLYHINKYMTNEIVRNGLNLLASGQLEHTIQYIFENDISNLLGNNLSYQSKLIDVIYICELNNSKINSILKKINNLIIKQLDINWDEGTILILASADNTDETYDRFHDMLINATE